VDAFIKANRNDLNDEDNVIVIPNENLFKKSVLDDLGGISFSEVFVDSLDEYL
jgi:hypothetical protein